MSGERQQGVFLAVPVFLLDSFPAWTFSGNVAGVVLLEPAAPDWWMQGVAAELGAPTTGLVDLLSARAGHARVRFFTPRQEIDACGHVTVAIATVLLDEGVWTVGPAAVTAAGGRSPLVLDVDDAGVRVELEMQQQLQHLDRDPVLPDLPPLLGRARPAPNQAPVIAGTGLRHLLLPVAAVEDLDALPMCVAGIADVSRELQVDTIGVYNIVGPPSARSRCACGICVPGSAPRRSPRAAPPPGPLVFVLADAGQLTPQRPTLRMLMGVEMQRPGRLSVKLDFDAEGTDRAVLARLHGYATRVLTGTIGTAH